MKVAQIYILIPLSLISHQLTICFLQSLLHMIEGDKTKIKLFCEFYILKDHYKDKQFLYLGFNK
jgi:hypothetical protein